DKIGKDKNLKLFGYGFILWLIPFLISFLFFDMQGKLTASAGLFNSVMSVVIIIVMAVLLLKYTKKISVNYLQESINAGIVWFLMSIILDILILVPMAKIDLGIYFTDIGLGYVVILVVAFFAGKLLEAKSEHSNKIFSQAFSTKK
ncbi:MAG: hypothetical protein WC652_06925, partial [archaeon]